MATIDCPWATGGPKGKLILGFVLNLVFLSRYMWPEGPWQRPCRCPQDSSGLFYITFSCLGQAWAVIVRYPRLLPCDPWGRTRTKERDKGKVHSRADLVRPHHSHYPTPRPGPPAQSPPTRSHSPESRTKPDQLILGMQKVLFKSAELVPMSRVVTKLR